jgi:hypothetical protein
MGRLLFAAMVAMPLVCASCSKEDGNGLPADSRCLEGYASPGYDGRCEGNRGCTELVVICGDCVCTLCWNERCVVATCDDGGSEECPGGPWFADIPRDSQEP